MSQPPERREGRPDRHEGSGRVLGIVPDTSRPGWSGRAVLELVEDAAGDLPGSLILDLAPGSTDLASRLDAGGAPGFAELVTGRAELWEVVRRDDEHDAFYLPCGSGIAGHRLAGSPPVGALAERVRSRDRLLVVLLDRDGVEATASSGWLDGVVLLGGEAGNEPDVPDDLPVIDYHGRPGATREREPGEVRHDRFRRRARSRRRIPRVAIGLVLAAGAAALAVAAGALPLRGPGSEDEAGASPVVSPSASRGPSGSQVGLPAASGPVSPGPLTVDFEAVLSSAEGRGAADDGAAPPGAIPSATRRQAGAGDRSSLAASRRTGPRPSVSDVDRAFHATVDTLARSIDFYYGQERRFRDGLIGCPALIRAHEWASELFVRLSLYRATLERGLDSTARERFRERSRDMEALDRSFRQNGCTRLAGRSTPP